MTNFEKIKEMDEIGLSFMLAYFADHQDRCSGDEWKNECEGCPIAEDGCCGFAHDPCNVSAFRWLLQEYKGSNDCFKVEHSDVNPCDFCKSESCKEKRIERNYPTEMCQNFKRKID